MSTRYKVVLVPFPFDDLTGAKVRTALCLTDPVGRHRHVVIAFITGNLDDQEPSDIVLDRDFEGFSLTGLKKPSLLRLHRLTTVTTRVIQRELGLLDNAMRANVERRLADIFGLEGK